MLKHYSLIRSEFFIKDTPLRFVSDGQRKNYIRAFLLHDLQISEQSDTPRQKTLEGNVALLQKMQEAHAAQIKGFEEAGEEITGGAKRSLANSFVVIFSK